METVINIQGRLTCNWISFTFTVRWKQEGERQRERTHTNERQICNSALCSGRQPRTQEALIQVCHQSRAALPLQSMTIPFPQTAKKKKCSRNLLILCRAAFSKYSSHLDLDNWVLVCLYIDIHTDGPRERSVYECVCVSVVVSEAIFYPRWSYLVNAVQ